MVELTKVTFENPTNEKLSSGIRVIKNKTLLAPGVWNGRNYSQEEIIKAYNNSDWNDKDVISLISDHRDDNEKGRPLTIRDWLGFVSNHSVDGNGFVRGDLNLCDADLATKLIEGEAKFGISPFVYGMFDGKNQKDFIFKNFAVVVEPACKECYVNLSDDEKDSKISELSNEERIDTKLEETESSDVAGSEIKSKGLQPIKVKKKKKSNLIEMKGGKKNMEKNLEEVKEKPEEENKEDKLEEVEEKEVKEDVEEKLEEVEEEKPEEEKVEEESEDKMLENIAKMTEKYLKKKQLTPEQAKMAKIEKEISFLKKAVAKLQEEKEEPEEEVKENGEKMSARPRTMARSISKGNDFNGFCGNGPSEGTKEFASMLGY